MPGSRRTRATWASAFRWSAPAPLGRQQQERDVHRLTVQGLEIDRPVEPREQAEQAVETRQLAVRDGDALPDPGRAQPLALEQRVEDRPLVERRQPAHRLRGEFLKHLLLARARRDCTTDSGSRNSKIGIDRPLPRRPSASERASSQGVLSGAPDYQWAENGPVPAPFLPVHTRQSTAPGGSTQPIAPSLRRYTTLTRPVPAWTNTTTGIPSYRGRSPPRRWSGAAGSWCSRRRSAGGRRRPRARPRPPRPAGRTPRRRPQWPRLARTAGVLLQPMLVATQARLQFVGGLLEARPRVVGHAHRLDGQARREMQHATRPYAVPSRLSVTWPVQESFMCESRYLSSVPDIRSSIRPRRLSPNPRRGPEPATIPCCLPRAIQSPELESRLALSQRRHARSVRSVA